MQILIYVVPVLRMGLARSPCDRSNHFVDVLLFFRAQRNTDVIHAPNHKSIILRG